MKLEIRNFLNNILDLIYPIECLGCKKEGEWLCEGCFKTIPINDSPYCLECKIKTVYGEFCERCKDKYNLNGVFIASDYDNELIQKLIKTLKYKFISDISKGLSKLLFLFIQEQIKSAFVPTASELRRDKENQKGEWSESIGVNSNNILSSFSQNLIVPVPLHKKRQRWRGFNQAEVLAKNFVEHYSSMQLDEDSLQRTRHTKAQAKLYGAARKQNLKNSFQWRNENLGGRNVIIIDDVTTTGATLEECARVLKKAGAGEVWGLVVAKG